MPYITLDDREPYTAPLEDIQKQLPPDGDTTLDGHLNYIITSLIMRAYALNKRPRYTRFNAAIGVLEAVKLEMYRRAVAGYEDKCIEKNGDISVYSGEK